MPNPATGHYPHITGHQRSAEADALLAAIVESSDDAIIACDLDGTIASWNRSAERLYGYSAAEAIGQSVTMLMPPDRANEESAILERIRRGESVEHYETIRRRKDGTLVDVSLTVSPVLSAPGQVIGASKIARDITERKNAERVQRESQFLLDGQREALQSALDGAPLETSLGVLVRTAIESVGQDARAGFYLANDECTAIHHVVGMPADYAEAVDGFKVGPDALACGLATATGKPVLTADVRNEPLWQPWLWMAEKFDYRACWSFPIQTRTGKFIGTLAIYSRHPREATLREQKLASLLTRTAAIIIVRHQESEVRKQAEQALRESEARFRTMADALPVLIWVSDETKACTWFNKYWRDFTARPMEELLGDGWARDVHPDDLERCLDIYSTHFDARQPFSMEYRLRRRDGEYRWVLDEGIPRFGPGGDFAGYIGACLDIAERKRAEQSSADMAENLRLVLDAAPALISYIDRSMTYRFVNKAYEDWFGRKREQITGRHVREVLGEEAFEQLRPRFEAAISGQRIQFEDEVHYATAGNRAIHGDYVPDIKSNGEIAGFYVMVTDISERKQAEQALRESEARFRMIADNISALAWTCDKLGNVTWYNQRWLDYTGLSFEEMKDWGWTKCHHPDHVESVVATVTHSRNTGEPWEHTFPLRGKDGQYRWFLSRAVPIRNGNGEIVRWFGTNTDITELRDAQEALRRHQAELEETIKQRTEEAKAALQRMAVSDRMAAVGTLASGLAHDMNNLLFPLNARLERLLTNQRTEPEIHDELVILSALMDHLRDLSKNLSLFSRDPEKEGIVGRTNVPQWQASVQKLLDASVGREIVVKWDCCENLPDAAIAPHRMTQAVQNLIHNARDAVLAAKSGGLGGAADPRMMPRIKVRAQRSEHDPSFIELSVSDNGIGMDEQTKRRCIEPFFTTRERCAAPETARGGSGSGLGLSLAHAIVEKAGGFLEIESAPGSGTTVTLAIPMADAAKTA